MVTLPAVPKPVLEVTDKTADAEREPTELVKVVVYTARESKVKSRYDRTPSAERNVTVTVSCVELGIPRTVAAGVPGRARVEAVAVITMATGALRLVLA